MSTLKTLNLTALPKHSSSDPVVSRRAKLLKQLEQQLALAKNPLFVATAQKWRKDEAGNKQLVEKQKRVKKWWFVDLLGNCFFVVRYGTKIIEIEKGKGAIAIGDIANLDKTIETLIDAVRSGEFDALLNGIHSVGKKAVKKAA